MPWTLNRELLMPVNRRIAFAVELATGHPPVSAALDRLTKVAAHYGQRPAAWFVAGSAGAPPLRTQGRTIQATAPLDPETSYVFVRYVGEELAGWGLSYTVHLQGRAVYVILINQERHRRWRWAIPERHLEAQTLVHEYGHLLGLPPYEHGYYPLYPSLAGGAHCVNPDCALSKPRFRTLLYGFAHICFGRHYLEDYCAACRAAIAAAQDFWRQQERERLERQAAGPPRASLFTGARPSLFGAGGGGSRFYEAPL